MTEIYSKIPPQAGDIEQAVIGALLIDKDALLSVIDMLKPDIFYHDKYKIMCEAIIELYRKSEPIDILTLSEELKKKEKLDEVGGYYAVTTITNSVVSSAHIVEHVKILYQKYLAREVIRISADATRLAYDDSVDVFDLLNTANKQFSDVSNINFKEAVKLSEIIKSNIQKVEQLRSEDKFIFGIPSGLQNLDRVTNGWTNTDLVIIAARPAMGKSAMVVTAAANAAIDYNIPVAVFSLEMSKEQLTDRILSMRSEIDMNTIKRGSFSDLEIRRLKDAQQKIGNAPMFIDDTPALSCYELRAKARRLKIKYGIQLVIVDYLQIMQGSGKKGQSRDGEIGEISRTLKVIAKELDVPVIALSQLSRKVEDRGGAKKPMLSDLRESGSIEQDADMVIFIHRPEYYGITTDEEGNSTHGVAELIIAKHRNGGLDTIKTNFVGQYTRFEDFVSENRHLTPLSNHTGDNPYQPKEKLQDLPF